MGSDIETECIDSRDHLKLVLDRISAFYEYQRVPYHSKTYMVLDTGGYNTYVFRPERQAIEWLLDRIRGGSLKSRLGAATLRTFSRVPHLLSFVPMIRSEPVDTAIENPFDVAIIGDRITLLQFQDRKAYTIALDNEAKLQREIECRERLPKSINTPEMLEVDCSYPYLVERYHEGSELVDPIEEWDRMLEALTQLTALYQINRRSIETDAAVRMIREELAEKMDGLIQAGFDLLETFDLPPAVYQGLVHGDFHAGNVITNNSVHILDWEDVHMDYVLDDFFRPFIIHQYDVPVHRLFIEMIENRETGGRIMSDYARTLGPTAYGETEPYSGLPLFYLLSLLAKLETNDLLRTSCREIFSQIVCKYE